MPNSKPTPIKLPPNADGSSQFYTPPPRPHIPIMVRLKTWLRETPKIFGIQVDVVTDTSPFQLNATLTFVEGQRMYFSAYCDESVNLLAVYLRTPTTNTTSHTDAEYDIILMSPNREQGRGKVYSIEDAWHTTNKNLTEKVREFAFLFNPSNLYPHTN